VAEAYCVKVFKNGQEDTAKHVRYRRHTHIYTHFVFTVYLEIIKNSGSKNVEKVNF
jgi:hypothetical protein